jgi:calcineurin-like phosphoesterase family protein
MKTWIITDTHLGHSRLIEYCGRPINHTDIILENLDRMIQPGDYLIHLGDICIGNDRDWHHLLNLSLQGVKKILVRGNHDKKSNAWYLDHGWDAVCENFTLKVENKTIVFSHIPLVDNGYDYNIHGHFHNKEHRREKPEMKAIANDKQKLVAVEYTNYQPVLLTTLLKQYARKRKD